MAGEYGLPKPAQSLTHINSNLQPIKPINETLTLLIPQVPSIEAEKDYLQRKAKQPVSTETYIKALKELGRRVNLKDVIAVERAIANYMKRDPKTHELTDNPVSNRWKRQCVTAYGHYCKVHNITWTEKPNYKVDEKTIQPPTDEKCAIVLAGARSDLSIKIDISTQTGLRPVEVVGTYKGLKVKDFRPETRTITPTSAKGCNARPPIPIDIKLATKLQEHIIKKHLKPNDVLFNEDSASYSNTFLNYKKRLAEKLKDPSITNIRLYDLRHYYITKIARRIQNMELVRQKTGHKQLSSMQKYLHLIDNNGEWIVESTQDQKRADELLRQDFTYCLTSPDGYMKFRKPK